MPTKTNFDIVLSVFNEDQDYGAFELLDTLKKRGMTESDFKEAVAYLLNEHQLMLTPERRLRIVHAPTHA